MYAKIFEQIYGSSIVEKPELRFTFMDLLILADPDGVVDMTHESIARRTNRPLETIRSTIAELEAPDPMSRTPDAEGARLKRLDTHRDWGWMIINFDRFLKLASEAERREKTRDRVKKFRQKMRAKPQSNDPVTHRNASVTHKKDIDVDVDVNKDIETNTPPKPPSATPIDDTPGFGRFWKAWPKHFRKNSRGECLKKWKKLELEPRADHVIAMLEQAKLTRDWTKEDGQYIPGPLPWINQGKWDGELSAPAPEGQEENNGF